jgi:LmbE family N-acetylglucosaminyl deacetylase
MRKFASRRHQVGPELCPASLRILVVFAHPDDESFGPAAVLAKYAQLGAKVFGLVFTRGQFGQTDMLPRPSPTELGRLRTHDLIDAARVIGFRDLVILDFIDGSLAKVPLPQLESDVLTALRRFQPNVVITFGPGGITHHPDHVAVYQATTRAFGWALARHWGVQQLYYSAVPPDRAAEMNLAGLPDGMPNTLIEVGETEPIKIEALRMHARHVVDAREFLSQLARDSQNQATLYRAWPPVPTGTVVADFCGQPMRELVRFAS